MNIKSSFLAVISLFFLLFTSCETNYSIVNNVDEREANEILVFLASKGITAEKTAASSGEGIGGGASNMWNISTEKDDAVQAMSYLNQYGLPRRKGSTILELFAKEGLMTSDREETIRYQAGLAEELKNTIRKIDGVIDADVQISFPTSEEVALPGAVKQKITAAVYIKHQGVMDQLNNHLETKIKRLVSASIHNLDYDNVSVISDKALFADIVLYPQPEKIGMKQSKEQVSIWSIVMAKNSLARFRFIFFTLLLLLVGFGGVIIWLSFRFYPQIFQKFLPKKQENKVASSSLGEEKTPREGEEEF